MKPITHFYSLLVVILAVAAIPTTASAAHYDFFVAGLYYKITSTNTVMVTYQHEPTSATRGITSSPIYLILPVVLFVFLPASKTTARPIQSPPSTTTLLDIAVPSRELLFPTR